MKIATETSERKPLPDISTLREALTYDCETGRFVWLRRPRAHFASDIAWKRWNTRFAGHEAFRTENGHGYFVGVINGKTYMAHRIAYAMSIGDPMDLEIDHINGDRMDNRLENLRPVTSGINKRNSQIPSHNTSGRVGVAFRASKRKWRASITIDNRHRHIGYYDTFEQAVFARLNVERKNNFHSNHGRPKCG